jgi:nitrogen regulatory protein PII
MTDDNKKLRLELIIESPALRRAEDLLRDAGATGWTVVPAMSGFGGQTRGSRGTDISEATYMVVLICIADEDVLEPALKTILSMLDRRIGVVNVSDVRVLRPGLF